jgi:CRP-like cAMP-binding protein
VFEAGSVGWEFFIIMSGECKFYQKPRDEVQENTDEAQAKESALVDSHQELASKSQTQIPFLALPQIFTKSLVRGFSTMIKIMRTRVEKRGKKYYLYEGKTMMIEVNQMRDGGSFGEYALLSSNPEEQRSATVLCTADTDLLVLDRKSYIVRCASIRKY